MLCANYFEKSQLYTLPLNCSLSNVLTGTQTEQVESEQFLKCESICLEEKQCGNGQLRPALQPVTCLEILFMDLQCGIRQLASNSCNIKLVFTGRILLHNTQRVTEVTQFYF